MGRSSATPLSYSYFSTLLALQLLWVQRSRSRTSQFNLALPGEAQTLLRFIFCMLLSTQAKLVQLSQILVVSMFLYLEYLPGTQVS